MILYRTIVEIVKRTNDIIWPANGSLISVGQIGLLIMIGDWPNNTIIIYPTRTPIISTTATIAMSIKR